MRIIVCMFIRIILLIENRRQWIIRNIYYEHIKHYKSIIIYSILIFLQRGDQYRLTIFIPIALSRASREICAFYNGSWPIKVREIIVLQPFLVTFVKRLNRYIKAFEISYYLIIIIFRSIQFANLMEEKRKKKLFLIVY